MTNHATSSSPVDEDPPYDVVLHETLAIVNAAVAVHFPGLPGEAPTEPPSKRTQLLAKLKHKEKTSLQKLLEKEVVALRHDRIRSGLADVPPALNAKRRVELIAQRNEMLERVEKAQELTSHFGRSWAQKLRQTSIKALDDWFLPMSNSPYDDLVRLFGRGNHVYVPTHTTTTLLETGNWSKARWQTEGMERFNKRNDKELDFLVVADWKTLLTLQARVKLWEDDVQDAFIASKICALYGELKWIKVLSQGAVKIGVRLPVLEESVQVKLRRVEDMAKLVELWPQSEKDVEPKIKVKGVLSDLMKSIMKQTTSYTALIDTIAADVGTRIRESTANKAKLVHLGERKELKAEIEDLQRDHKRIIDSQAKDKERNVSPTAQRIITLGKMVAKWYATMLKHHLRVQFAQPFLALNTNSNGRNSGNGPQLVDLYVPDALPGYSPPDMHGVHTTENSVRHSRGRGVPAAISARTARRYNI